MPPSASEHSPSNWRRKMRACTCGGGGSGGRWGAGIRESGRERAPREDTACSVQDHPHTVLSLPAIPHPPASGQRSAHLAHQARHAGHAEKEALGGRQLAGRAAVQLQCFGLVHAGRDLRDGTVRCRTNGAHADCQPASRRPRSASACRSCPPFAVVPPALAALAAALPAQPPPTCSSKERWSSPRRSLPASTASRMSSGPLNPENCGWARSEGGEGPGAVRAGGGRLAARGRAPRRLLLPGRPTPAPCTRSPTHRVQHD